MRRRVFTGLVTKKPATEEPLKIKKGNNEEKAIVSCILQDLSGGLERKLAVPQQDNPIADRVRELLLYDAAITPADMPGAYGIPGWALDVARLARADNLSRRRITRPINTTSNIYNALSDQSRLSSEQTQAAYAKIDILNSGTKTAANRSIGLSKHDFHNILTWDDVVRVAREIAESNPKEQPAYYPNAKEKGNGGEEDDDSDDFELSDDEYDSDTLEIPVFTGSYDPWQSRISAPMSGRGGVKWGIVSTGLNADRLPMISFRKKGTYKRRPEIEGCVPTNWHRLVTDEKLFRGAPRRKGPKGRGTILVDMSGSMGWSYDDFQELLATVPECSVYGYAGQNNLTHGRIVLLADRGLCADMKAVESWQYQHGTGSNVIDGPALSFLAKMTGPRIWISDGLVTGKGESTHEALYTQVAGICMAGRIKRVRHAHEARAVFLGLSEGKKIAGTYSAAKAYR